ncbi:hypothetical protein MN608_02057 [Microdochium nivale]|nr:hypothetical protein MN608_02057 [Microdochium nivale]
MGAASRQYFFVSPAWQHLGSATLMFPQLHFPDKKQYININIAPNLSARTCEANTPRSGNKSSSSSYRPHCLLNLKEQYSRTHISAVNRSRPGSTKLVVWNVRHSSSTLSSPNTSPTVGTA